MKVRVIECLQTGLLKHIFEIVFTTIQNTTLYTITVQKFTDRINIMLLGKIISVLSSLQIQDTYFLE